MKLREVFAVAGIIEHENEILCAQRKNYGNPCTALKWEFPGGKIEEGETKEQALKREIEEELNMEITIKNHFIDIRYAYPDFVLNMSCYKCETKTKNLSLNVHNDYKWLTKSSLPSLDWAPADIPIVEKLLNE